MKFKERIQELVDERAKLINDHNQLNSVLSKVDNRLIEVNALIKEYESIIENDKKAEESNSTN